MLLFQNWRRKQRANIKWKSRLNSLFILFRNFSFCLSSFLCWCFFVVHIFETCQTPNALNMYCISNEIHEKWKNKVCDDGPMYNLITTGPYSFSSQSQSYVSVEKKLSMTQNKSWICSILFFHFTPLPSSVAIVAIHHKPFICQTVCFFFHFGQNKKNPFYAEENIEFIGFKCHTFRIGFVLFSWWFNAQTIIRLDNETSPKKKQKKWNEKKLFTQTTITTNRRYTLNKASSKSLNSKEFDMRSDRAK